MDLAAIFNVEDVFDVCGDKETGELGDSFLLKPGQLVLAFTLEYIDRHGWKAVVPQLDQVSLSIRQRLQYMLLLKDHRDQKYFTIGHMLSDFTQVKRYATCLLRDFEANHNQH